MGNPASTPVLARRVTSAGEHLWAVGDNKAPDFIHRGGRLISLYDRAVFDIVEIVSEEENVVAVVPATDDSLPTSRTGAQVGPGDIVYVLGLGNAAVESVEVVDGTECLLRLANLMYPIVVGIHERIPVIGSGSAVAGVTLPEPIHHGGTSHDHLAP